MRKNALLLTVLVTALAVPACGDVRWARPGGDETALEQDLKTCHTAAAEKAARMGSLGPPSPALDPKFGAPPGPTPMDLRVQERQIEERCMRDRGYVLTPAGK